MTTSHHFTPTPVRTYTTAENAVKAVSKKYPAESHFGGADLHYVIVQHTDGRFFPLFFGERALRATVHLHFNVCA